MAIKVKAPSEANDIVKEIYELQDVGGIYALAGYAKKDLVSAKNILIRHREKFNLQKAIIKELKAREELNKLKKSKAKNEAWFAPLWWAVLSLYGKGGCDKKDPDVQKMLDGIKAEWASNK